jgi:hypothetical protein
VASLAAAHLLRRRSRVIHTLGKAAGASSEVTRPGMLHTQSLSEAALERRSTRGLECLAVARTLAARHGITKTRFVKQLLETLLCTSAPSDPSPQRRGGAGFPRACCLPVRRSDIRSSATAPDLPTPSYPEFKALLDRYVHWVLVSAQAVGHDHPGVLRDTPSAG